MLVVFQGPDTYVRPSWYPSKRTDGKVVPTWNYSSVQAQGRARVVQETDWLRAHVAEITDYFERTQSRPWSLADAPENYFQGQLKGIVGLESAIEGKLKMSQNRSAQDRAGVSEGIIALGLSDLAGLVCPHA